MAKICDIRTINDEEFEMIPLPQEKWMKQAIRDEEEALEREALYEEGLQAFVDPWYDWTRQEERLIEAQTGFGELPEEVNHEKSDWPRVNKRANGTMIIDRVEGFYLSHIESDNPYYAVAYPSYKNPDREQLIRDNRVPRKHTDQITQYMGNPTYGQRDRLIYTDIYGHIDSLSVHIRTTNNINNIRCAMIHTPKGTVKVVTVKEGYIGELDMDTISSMQNIPIKKIKVIGMFDDKGKALPTEHHIENMDIKGCPIEISYLKDGDCLFDRTRQRQIREKKARINKSIQMRIDSLRSRKTKTIEKYLKGYISESKAEEACARYDKAIELQKERMV